MSLLDKAKGNDTKVISSSSKTTSNNTSTNTSTTSAKKTLLSEVKNDSTYENRIRNYYTPTTVDKEEAYQKYRAKVSQQVKENASLYKKWEEAKKSTSESASATTTTSKTTSNPLTPYNMVANDVATGKTQLSIPTATTATTTTTSKSGTEIVKEIEKLDEEAFLDPRQESKAETAKAKLDKEIQTTNKDNWTLEDYQAVENYYKGFNTDSAKTRLAELNDELGKLPDTDTRRDAIIQEISSTEDYINSHDAEAFYNSNGYFAKRAEKAITDLDAKDQEDIEAIYINKYTNSTTMGTSASNPLYVDNASAETSNATLLEKGYTQDEIDQLVYYYSRVADAKRDTEWRENLQELYDKSNVAGKIGLYALSFGTNVVSSVPTALGARIEQAVNESKYEDAGSVDPNSKWFGSTQVTSQLRSMAQESVNDWGTFTQTPILNSGMTIGDFAFNTFTSAVDSAIAKVLGAGMAGGSDAAYIVEVVSGLMATQVFNNEVYNNVQRGMSEDEAYIRATASAIIEGATEKWSTEKLLENFKNNSSFWKKLAKQFLAEASEEGTSDIANSLVDLRFDDSEWVQEYENLVANGMSEEQALVQTMGDMFVSITLSSASGGFSAVGSIGVGYALGMGANKAETTVNNTKNKKTVKKLGSISNLSEESQQAIEKASNASALGKDSAKTINEAITTVTKEVLDSGDTKKIEEYSESIKGTKLDNKITQHVLNEAQKTAEFNDLSEIEKNTEYAKKYSNQDDYIEGYKKVAAENPDITAYEYDGWYDEAYEEGLTTPRETELDAMLERHQDAVKALGYDLITKAYRAGQAYALEGNQVNPNTVKYKGTGTAEITSKVFEDNNLNAFINTWLEETAKKTNTTIKFSTQEQIDQSLKEQGYTNTKGVEGYALVNTMEIVVDNVAKIPHEMLEVAGGIESLRTETTSVLDMVGKYIVESGQTDIYTEAVKNYQKRYARVGQQFSFDKASEELKRDIISAVVFNGDRICESVANDTTKTAEEKKDFITRLKDLIDKFISAVKEWLEGQSYDSAHILAEKFTNEMRNEIAQKYDALLDRIGEETSSLQKAEEVLDKAGIAFDGTSVFSIRYVTLADDEDNPDGRVTYTQLKNALMEATQRSEEDVKKWLENEMSIVNLVLQYQEYLDFAPDDRYEAIKTDSDYPQGTVDLSNLCIKRALLTDIFTKFQKEFPDKIITAEDLALLRKVLIKNHIPVNCGFCFVEDRRQLVGEVAQTYIDMYKAAKESGNAIQKTNAKGEKIDLTVTQSKYKEYKSQFDVLGLKANDTLYATDDYIPNQYDITTYEGFKALQEEHPAVALPFLIYNSSRGQQSVRLIEGRAEYKRQILDWSAERVKKCNDNGGLRIFSFSDFEAIHLLDLVQIITDCATKGVMIQGYTKVPAFAKLVANTGIKLNMSLIPKGVKGFKIVDGKAVLLYDNVEGIDTTDKDFKSITSDNENVGHILIGINDEHIGYAMLDDFIDYIIPYHTNKALKVLDKLGISTWTNYKAYQRETSLETGKGTTDVNIYTDVLQKYDIKNKYDFVNAFLEECKKQGKRPRFYQFLNHDAEGNYTYREGYHKLLIDFKLFDKQGNILPQGYVTPDFNSEAIDEILQAEIKRKSEFKFPDEVYEEVKATLAEAHPENKAKLNLSIAEPVEETENLIAVHNLTEDKLMKTLGLGGFAMPSIAVTKTSIPHTNFGDISVVFNKQTVDPQADSRNTVYSADAWTPTFPQIEYKANENVVKALRDKYYDMKDKFPDLKLDRLYSFDEIAIVALPQDTSKELLDMLDSKGINYRQYSTAEERQQIVNSIPDVRFSLAEDYAPTFYSKAIKEIEKYKGEKIGASTVVNYLTGRGISKEEIKWSGIVPFLEGKKSVTKTELLEFMRANQLVVEEKVLSRRRDYDAEQLAKEEYDTAKDNADKAKEKFYSTLSQINEDLVSKGYMPIGDNVIRELERNNNTKEIFEFNVVALEDRNYNKRFGLKEIINEGLYSRGKNVSSYYDTSTNYLLSKEKALKESYMIDLTRWRSYSVIDTNNYREYLYSLPNSKYGNGAMEAHWHMQGILAHARVNDYLDMPKAERLDLADFLTANINFVEEQPNFKAMLIEEIQSDWHNAGDKHGYQGDNQLSQESLINRQREIENEISNMMKSYLVGVVDPRSKDKVEAVNSLISLLVEENKINFELINISSISEEQHRQVKQLEREYKANQKTLKYTYDIPDAPYRNGKYVEFVLKDLIRKSAEGEYDYLAWTTAQMQSDRWSNKYAEGYRIEYDQQIPSFLKKYCKQWGAELTYISVQDKEGNTIEVPAIPITESMKDTVLYSGQPSFSIAETDNEIEVIDDETKLTQEEIRRLISQQNKAEELVSLFTNLQKRTATAEHELSTTEYGTTKMSAIRKFVSELTYGYKLDVSRDEIANELADIAKLIKQSTDGRVTGKEEEIVTRVNDIADYIADNVYSMDADLIKYATEKADTLQSTFGEYLYLTASEAKDVNPPVSYGRTKDNQLDDIRKVLFGTTKVTSDEAHADYSIDKWYGDNIDVLGEYNDQYEALNGTIGEIVQARYIKANGLQIDSHQRNMLAEEIADGIMGGLYNLPNTNPTTVDKLKSKIEHYKQKSIDEYQRGLLSGKMRQGMKMAAEHRHEVESLQKRIESKQKQIEKLRISRDERVKEIRDKYANYRQERVKSAYRSRIKKMKSRLDTMLLNPTENQYIPVDMMKSLAEFLDALTENYTGRSKNTLIKLQNLKDKYAELKADNALAYDDIIANNLTALKNIIGNEEGVLHLGSMDRNQLEQTYTILSSTLHYITNYTKVIGDARKRDAWKLGSQMISETEHAKKFVSPIETYVDIQLNPARMFNRLGGYIPDSAWNQAYDILNEGQLRESQSLMEGSKIFLELMKDKKNLKTLLDYKQTFDIGLVDSKGNSADLTKQQVLAIYMNILCEGNHKHMMGGGIELPNARMIARGHSNDAFKTVNVTKVVFGEGTEENDFETIRHNIEKILTDYDRAWIQAGQKMFAWGRDKMQETTKMVYGFYKPMVDNYYPLFVDGDYLKQDAITQMNVALIENASISKSRISGATQPIKIFNYTDVLDKHIKSVARYSKLIGEKNFNRIFKTNIMNFEAGQLESSYETSLVKTLNDYGGRARKYIDNLAKDYAGARNQDGTIFDKIKGNYAQAVLATNLAVTMKQTASYIIASAELGYKPVMKALVQGGKSNRLISRADKELIAKYTPLLWYRSQGINTEIGDANKNKSWTDNLGFIMQWIEKADISTVGRLWYASEYYVQDNFDLEKGTQEEIDKGESQYYQKVAEVFNRMVEMTQPNYTIMQSPDILRNPNKLVRSLTMFMTQRLQNGGILFDSIAQYNALAKMYKESPDENLQVEVKRSAKKMAWGISSVLFSSLTLACMNLLAKGLTRRLDDYRDEDGEINTSSVLEGYFEDLIDTIMSNVVGGSQLSQMISDIIEGSKSFDILSVGAISTINDLYEDLLAVIQDADGLPKWESLVFSLGQALGVPIGNLKKIVSGAIGNVMDIAEGNNYGEYGYEVSTSQYKSRMGQAILESDYEKFDTEYQKMYDDYIAEGKTEEEAASSADSNVKDTIKTLYTDQSIDEATAIDYLTVYLNYTILEAEKAVAGWNDESYSKVDAVYDTIGTSDYDEYHDAYIKGSTAENPEEAFESTMKSEIGSRYISGELNVTQAKSKLKSIGLSNDEAMEYLKDKVLDKYRDSYKLGDTKNVEQKIINTLRSIGYDVETATKTATNAIERWSES